MTFKVGDVVVLKSGSENMTVTNIHEDGDVEVRWFVNGDLRGSHVPAFCLISKEEYEAAATQIQSNFSLLLRDHMFPKTSTKETVPKRKRIQGRSK